MIMGKYRQILLWRNIQGLYDGLILIISSFQSNTAYILLFLIKKKKSKVNDLTLIFA